MCILLLFLALVISQVSTPDLSFQQQDSAVDPASALHLIRLQKYNDAITRLERTLEREPNNGEALTYIATANLYLNRTFTKAKAEFEEAFKKGGGATFLVSHSHENVLAGSDFVDYCRGWLHLRNSGVEFVPIESDHGFKLQYPEITEFKQNRFGKTLFHLKFGGKSHNFRGRTGDESEALLVVALYKRFNTN